MEVKYIDHMGSDLTCVNAARVSFNKESEWREEYRKHQLGEVYTHFVEYDLKETDKKLINYLAKHGHWTPFGHPQISLHFKVPIFVARQIHKHQVGFVVNEVSRRYVSEEPTFYLPYEMRLRAEDKKQGSKEETTKDAHPIHQWAVVAANKAYQEMLEIGVAPEQARMVLPLSTYTEFWMTGSLAAWARLYNLRIQPDAQKEVQEVAKQIGEIVGPLFPVSWEALTSD